MIKNKLELIGEQTSPLFRIMWVQNFPDPTRRFFDNNISGFHIGNGFILSVGHNLRTDGQIVKAIDDEIYQREILPNLNPDKIALFNKCYLFDPINKKWFVNITDSANIPLIIELFKDIKFDTRWITFMDRKFCQLFLIAQFKNNQYYNDGDLTKLFDATTCFNEPSLNRYTFLLEVELVEAFYSEDISLYRIINTPQNLINKLPSIGIDFRMLDDDLDRLYCIQSSPNGSLGHLLNKATIEGYIDHHSFFEDKITGNYVSEGSRYLIRGYFRFGSSGAPYVFFDNESGEYKVNAIQSEASPIQLSINNSRDGNFQYVNAIASPLSLIEKQLKAHLNI